MAKVLKKASLGKKTLKGNKENESVSVEKVKLKQDLILEILKKDKNETQTKGVFEISSKIDFLVKIFDDAKRKEEEAIELFSTFRNEVESKLNEFEKKIDSLIENSDNQEKKILQEEKEQEIENKSEDNQIEFDKVNKLPEINPIH